MKHPTEATDEFTRNPTGDGEPAEVDSGRERGAEESCDESEDECECEEDEANVLHGELLLSEKGFTTRL